MHISVSDGTTKLMFLSRVHIAYTLQIAKNNSNKVINIYLPVELPQLSVAV